MMLATSCGPEYVLGGAAWMRCRKPLDAFTTNDTSGLPLKSVTAE